jgi:DNA-binding MarR family transcriptional regulator
LSVRELDPVIHAPARLQIVAFLAGVNEAEFAVLRDAAEVSDSVLSKHLTQLQDAGYVAARKAASGGRQRTWLSLTRAGRKAFAQYVKALEGLARIAQRAAE